jgi:phosphatidate cytidylyltransferase
VAGDKRDGDDLFEDLDKFFAPIKDVEFGEPASAGALETPSEEHVSVKANEPAPTPSSEPAAEATSGDELDDETLEDEDWYDTTVLETIEGIGIDDDADAEAESGEVVEVGDASDDDDPDDDIGGPIEPTPGQEDLFAAAAAGDEHETESGSGWESVADDGNDAEYAEPTLVGDDDLGTETAPIATIDELMGDVESPEGAGDDAGFLPPSVGDEATGDETEPAVVGGSVGWDDGSAITQGAGSTMLGELGPDETEQDILSDLSEPEPEHEAVVVGAEGLGGPSWQEPGALEVDRRGPAPDERDVPAAFLTGGILAIAALAALLIGDWLFGLLAAAIVLLAQGELFGVMVKHHRQPATAVGLIAGALMLAAGYFRGESAVLAMFALGVAATFLWFMSGPSTTRKDVAANIGLTVLNMSWVPLLGSYLLVLLEGESGTSLVLSVIGLTFVYDTAAFLSGSVWGGQFFERPLAPTVSPKKSVEGVIIGSLVTVVVAVTIVTSFVDPFESQRIEALLLGLVVAAAATFGDLAESLVKRDMGIKDMGSILPGHGGVLDRIDSVLFVAPAAFFLYRIIVV